MNEAETRAEHIEPALSAAGWGEVDGSRVLREHHITQGRLQGAGNRARADIADYVLVYRNTKLGVIEAKAWGKPLTEGVGQAKNYAAKLAVRFTYSTNGQGFYGIDMQSGTEGEIEKFPSPDVLWAQTFAEVNVWRDRFAAVDQTCVAYKISNLSLSWKYRFSDFEASNLTLQRATGKGRCFCREVT